MDWQPIETAPKDGTDILGCVLGYSPIVIRWVSVINAWSYFSPTMFTNSGVAYEFWDTYCRNTLSGKETFEPTHWMPLPEPPK